MPFFAIVLPQRHCSEEEYTLGLIYALNELNLGQNRDEENSLVFKAMRLAWRCQGHEHITQSVVDRIMVAASAANDKVLKIALPPQRFQWAVDSTDSILHMIWAIFAQLGHASNEYSRPFMQFNGLGDGIFCIMYVLIEDEGHWRVSVKVGPGRMELLWVPRAQYKFGTVAPDRPADALRQANTGLGRTRNGQRQGCQNQQIPSMVRSLRCQRGRRWQANVLLPAMQGRRDHGLVLQQSVPGRPLSSAQACKCNDSVIVHCCSLRDCRVCGRLLSPPAPAGVGRATAADGRLRGPSSPPLLLRYRHAAAVTASDGAGRSGAGLAGRGAVRLSSPATVAAPPP